MTERLSQLLHDEADHLPVPPVTADVALARGRGMHRRRTTFTALGTAAVLAVLTAGGVAVVDRVRGDDPIQLADAAAYEQHGAWMADGRLHVGNHSVDIEEKINAVYYTAAGVVVRTGPTGDRTSPDAGHLSLLRPDGTLTPLTPRLDDVEPGTSPDSSLIVFGRPAGSGFEAVVWDVATDREVATIPYDGSFEWGGWAAPPMSISGDHVYASLDHQTLAINWRTGETAPLAGAPGGRWETIAGDVWADEQRGQVVVRSLADSSPVLTAPAAGDFAESWLSPDGRYVVVQPEDVETFNEYPTATLHEVATGESRQLPAGGWAAGWTPDGHALVLDGRQIKSCDAISEECVTVTEVEDPDSVRLAETYYGS